MKRRSLLVSLAAGLSLFAATPASAQRSAAYSTGSPTITHPTGIQDEFKGVGVVNYILGDTLNTSTFEINGIFYGASSVFSTINSTSSSFSCLVYFPHATGNYSLLVRVHGWDSAFSPWHRDTALVNVNH